MSSRTRRNCFVHYWYAVCLLDIAYTACQPSYHVGYCLVIVNFFEANGVIEDKTFAVTGICAFAEFLAEKVERLTAAGYVEINNALGIAVFAEYNAFFHNDTSFLHLTIGRLRVGMLSISLSYRSFTL